MPLSASSSKPVVVALLLLLLTSTAGCGGGTVGAPVEAPTAFGATVPSTDGPTLEPTVNFSQLKVGECLPAVEYYQQVRSPVPCNDAAPTDQIVAIHREGDSSPSPCPYPPTDHFIAASSNPSIELCLHRLR